MRKILKWLGIGLSALAAIAIIGALAVYFNMNSRLNKVYDAPEDRISIPADADSLAQGKHLVDTRCAGCHGLDLAGDVMFDDAVLGTVVAPNISQGRGVQGQLLGDHGLVSAIRYGIDPDGKGLIIMPSDALYYLNDKDLGAIIAYLNSTPPVEKDLPAPRNTFIGTLLIGAGAFGEVLAVERIDQSAARPEVQPGITAEYGQYLVITSDCSICHGQELRGGKNPNPESPPAPDLTRSGELLGWTETDFINTLRSGVTPSGNELDTAFMPWDFAGKMTDDELKAIWLYLQSLPVSAAME